MNGFSIAWTDKEGEHVAGPFPVPSVAIREARARANESAHAVLVVRPDGSPFMTIWPESSSFRKIRPPGQSG